MGTKKWVQSAALYIQTLCTFKLFVDSNVGSDKALFTCGTDQLIRYPAGGLAPLFAEQYHD